MKKIIILLVLLSLSIQLIAQKSVITNSVSISIKYEDQEDIKYIKTNNEINIFTFDDSLKTVEQINGDQTDVYTIIKHEFNIQKNREELLLQMVNKSDTSKYMMFIDKNDQILTLIYPQTDYYTFIFQLTIQKYIK